VRASPVIFGPRIPDFLSRVVALSKFMRLSLRENRIRGRGQCCVAGDPGNAGANTGDPCRCVVPAWSCGDREACGECRGIPHLAKNERDAPNFLYAALDGTACAALFKESRMKTREPTKLHRKSGICDQAVVEGIELGLHFHGNWIDGGLGKRGQG
jgi:hypothetical protein